MFGSSIKLETLAHTKTTLGNSIDDHYQNCDLQVTNTLFKKRKEKKRNKNKTVEREREREYSGGEKINEAFRDTFEFIVVGFFYFLLI